MTSIPLYEVKTNLGSIMQILSFKNLSKTDMCTSVKVKVSYRIAELTSSILVIENCPLICQEKIIMSCRDDLG